MEDLIRITKKVEELERKQLEVRRNLKKYRDFKRKWENIVSIRHQREIEEKKNEKPAVAFGSNPFASSTFASNPFAGYTGGIFGEATKPVPFANLNFTFGQPEAKRQRTD